MTATCPEGHPSESTDYCDICGSPIGAGEGAAVGGAGGSPVGGAGLLGAASPTAPPEAAPLVATQTCPHCGGPNVEDALFCESCGYDFTTGTPPLGSEPPPTEEVVPAEEMEELAPAEEPAAPEDPALAEAPAAPEAPAPAEAPAAAGAAGEAPGPDGATEPAPEHSDDAQPEPVAEPEPEPEPVADAQPEAQPEAAPSTPAPRKARHTPPSRALADTWVVEVWIDADWYAVQQTDEACPSPGVPDIVPLTRSTALIGRPSGSRGVRPDVDAGVDSAVSRRHAQLTSDGRRWWIEDLGSSNGTFVGTVGEPLPTAPIPAGQRVEIDRDDRIYVGAWTRLALRQATEAEERGEG